MKPKDSISSSKTHSMETGEAKKTILSRDTLIPVGFVLAIAGGIFWLSQMYSQVQQNRVAIGQIRQDITVIRDEQSDVSDRMARIETKIDLLLASFVDSSKKVE